MNILIYRDENLITIDPELPVQSVIYGDDMLEITRNADGGYDVTNAMNGYGDNNFKDYKSINTICFTSKTNQ